MTKLMMVLAATAGAMSFAATPVAADASCTEQYVKCLNDTWYYEGAVQDLADLECRAEYLGCVARAFFTL